MITCDDYEYMVEELIQNAKEGKELADDEIRDVILEEGNALMKGVLLDDEDELIPEVSEFFKLELPPSPGKSICLGGYNPYRGIALCLKGIEDFCKIENIRTRKQIALLCLSILSHERYHRDHMQIEEIQSDYIPEVESGDYNINSFELEAHKYEYETLRKHIEELKNK